MVTFAKMKESVMNELKDLPTLNFSIVSTKPSYFPYADYGPHQARSWTSCSGA